MARRCMTRSDNTRRDVPENYVCRISTENPVEQQTPSFVSGIGIKSSHFRAFASKEDRRIKTIHHNNIATMAKKPRSQRRKKGSKLGEQEDGATPTADVDVELLSETHTVADSMSTFDDFGE